MNKKIGLFYGSTTGNIEAAADLIQENLTDFEVEIFDIAESCVEEIQLFDLLIFGISTWEYGGLQDDWTEFWDQLDDLNLENKIVAVYGQGDQVGYDEWFQDGIGILHDKLVDRGATPVGYWPNIGYDFVASKGLSKDKSKFLGLSLDEDNQPELTTERIECWCTQLTTEIESALLCAVVD